MLPESKNDFPKCLYLDQNKWIDLARAHNGKPDGTKFRQCLNVVRTAVSSGKLIVPYSLENAVEAMVSRDVGRRTRLAEFMVGLSENKTLLSEQFVVPLEIVNATRWLFNLPAIESPRKSIVNFGFAHAIGIDGFLETVFPAQFGPKLAADLNTADSTVSYLVQCGNKRDCVQGARDGEANARQLFQLDRLKTEDMNRNDRLKFELRNLIRKNRRYQIAVKATLTAIGRTANEFEAAMKLDGNVAKFINAAPSLDVYIGLRILRDRDKDREVEHNDIRDLDWMSVAAPYCNFVVSEKYWGKKLSIHGFDSKYGTVLLTDLQKLPDQLSATGCSD